MPATTSFIEAAKIGDTPAVIAMLEADLDLVNSAGAYDKTALHWAAEKNDAVTAAVLVEAGADIEVRTSWGATPFEWAAVMGSRDVADLLLTKGANGFNLVTAAALGKLNDVKRFIENEREKVSDALHGAARNGHTETVAYLLDEGGDINQRGFFGATGTHWAAINGHANMVEFMIDHGADLTIEDDEFHSTPRSWAEEGGFGSIAAMLASKE